MALSDKNILITPNIGQNSDPKIVFSGADVSSGPQNITLQVYPTSNGTISFEGSAGQLFSITNNLSGTIFSVNDVSGIPSIEVLDTGLIKLAQYSGNVGIGNTTPTAKLDVVANSVMSTTNGVGGIKIENTSTKTYPTTAGFNATAGLYQNLELGTAQVIDSVTPGGLNFTYGIQNNLTKSSGNTQDIERLFFYGMYQLFNWTDLNTCKQYIGINDLFVYSGINANGRTTQTINCSSLNLFPPTGGTQTIAFVTSPNILAAVTGFTANINITSAAGYIANFRTIAQTTGTLTAAIGSYIFYDTSQFWQTTATGTAVNNTTITNLYGLRLRPPAASIGLTVTNNWGISQEWGSARNVFAGQTSIGGLLGAESLRVTTVASAVNYLQVTGAVTTGSPVLSAQGSDTNISIVLTPKGTGGVGIGTSSPTEKLDVVGNIKASGTVTATNFVGVLTPRISTITSAATITPTADTTNQYTITALATAATIAIPTGTPIDGQRLTIRIKDNGTARALTWTTSAGGYRVIGTTLPTTTVLSKVLYVGCIYNSQDLFWDVVSIAQEA